MLCVSHTGVSDVSELWARTALKVSDSMLLQLIDENADGNISRIEFIKALRKNPVLAKGLGLPSIIHQEDDSRKL
jgi:hypothetical protein